MLADFFVPMLTIAVAEIGDKTQLAMMALAAMKLKNKKYVFAMAFSLLKGKFIKSQSSTSRIRGKLWRTPG